MKSKVLKLLWIFLLVLSSFTLGYTLKPTHGPRMMPPFMTDRFTTSPGRMAPPLHFRYR